MSRSAVVGMMGLLACCHLAMAQQVEMSTFVGGEKADRLTAAAVLSDGSVVLGGVVDGTWGGEKGQTLENGRGLLLVLDKACKLAAQTTLPGAVSDLDVDAAGNILITGPGGTACFDRSLKPRWTAPLGGAEARVAAAGNGAAVLLADKKITLFDAQGHATGSFDVSGGFVLDVACDPKAQRIFVCGFDNKHGTPPGQRNYPVQVAFVRAMDFAGRPLWRAYGWAGQEVADLKLMADTRAYRLAFGPDGKLYVAGESAGGNTIWTRSSLDLGQPANFVKGDAFQHAYNTAANHITAVARLDPQTGQSEIATLLLARLASGKGNTIRPRALAADAQGNVYVGGVSTFSPPKTPGSFGGEGGGAFFVIFDRNLKRLYATTLAGGGPTQAIGVGGERIVAVGDTRTELTTYKPLKTQGDANGEGFAVVFRTGG